MNLRWFAILSLVFLQSCSGGSGPNAPNTLGLDTVKFIPASIAGGIPALKALASVFRTMKFMPTGGVSPGNLADFLAVPAVLACGGSWLTPKDAIEAGNYDVITMLAVEAVDIARKARQ